RPGQHFGTAVSLSGDTAAVGAGGSAYVFVRGGTGWTLQQKLTPRDIALEEGFGSTLAVAGDTLVVGAFQASLGGLEHSGAVEVFERSGSTWKRATTLTPSDAADHDAFGSSVAISGDTILVGAIQYDFDDIPFVPVGPGAAYVFARHGSGWFEQ